ncbi:hypothetical protein MLD38_031339 [Melastoma candidum]|uniref:Uncharacterized protein n=1 Tax=Melastoma candidum TaxID=119954 RepID=A0ACB9MPX3_9MYRT|nr:hypothetical protein MLD38_031339 [Melastoma candidum]
MSRRWRKSATLLVCQLARESRLWRLRQQVRGRVKRSRSLEAGTPGRKHRGDGLPPLGSGFVVGLGDARGDVGSPPPCQGTSGEWLAMLEEASMGTAAGSQDVREDAGNHRSRGTLGKTCCRRRRELWGEAGLLLPDLMMTYRR